MISVSWSVASHLGALRPQAKAHVHGFRLSLSLSGSAPTFAMCTKEQKCAKRCSLIVSTCVNPYVSDSLDSLQVSMFRLDCAPLQLGYHWQVSSVSLAGSDEDSKWCSPRPGKSEGRNHVTHQGDLENHSLLASIFTTQAAGRFAKVTCNCTRVTTFFPECVMSMYSEPLDIEICDKHRLRADWRLLDQKPIMQDWFCGFLQKHNVQFRKTLGALLATLRYPFMLRRLWFSLISLELIPLSHVSSWEYTEPEQRQWISQDKLVKPTLQGASSR